MCPPHSLCVPDHRHPAHSSSAPALLVASLPLAPAAADSAQHRYCSCRLIFHCIDRQSREDPGHRPSTVTSPSLLSLWFSVPRATSTTLTVIAPTLLAHAFSVAPPAQPSTHAHITSVSWATPNARRVCSRVTSTLTSSQMLQTATCTSTTPLPLPLPRTCLPLSLPRRLHRRLSLQPWLHQPLLLLTQYRTSRSPHSLEPHSLLQRRTSLPSPLPSMH
jgi:hypothetical protein